MKKIFYLTLLLFCSINNVSAFENIVTEYPLSGEQYTSDNLPDSVSYEVVLISLIDEPWVSIEKLASYIEKVTGLGKEDIANLMINTPSIIKKGISKEEAEDIRMTLIMKGGEAVVKPLESHE